MDLGFSSDGRCLTYLGETEDGKWRLVRNGATVGPTYGSVNRSVGLVRSPVGYSVALMVWESREPCVIVDGTRIAHAYDTIGWPCFDPKNGALVVIASKGGKQFLVKNGERITAEYDGVGSPVFASKGEGLAFPARLGDRRFAVRDCKRVGGQYDYVGRIAFSPSGNSIVFHASTEGKHIIVRDGVQIGKAYDYVDAVTFSPSGRSVAFIAHNAQVFEVVRDGAVVGEGYTGVQSMLRFSPDGMSLAYRAARGDAELLVRDGVVVHRDVYPDRTTAGFIGGAPVFSPDSRSMVFSVGAYPDRYYVWDGDPITAKGERVRDVFFGPSGNSVIVVKKVGDEICFARDGLELGGRFEAVSNRVTAPDGSGFVFAGIRDQRVYRVVVPW